MIFSTGSVGAALLMGVAFGNVIAGMPLDADGNITSGFWALLHPYALLVAATTIALFALHGAIYLVLKTEGLVSRRGRQRAVHCEPPARDFRRREFRAFLSSSATIALLLALAGIGLFPTLLRSMPLPERSLTIYNAASSTQTLGIMLTIAVIGIPVVLTYTTVIYSIFRGKVRLGSHSY